ncbi:BA75_02507T0 [Komagataella pastoris]|uniref:BA75_02507T0 n=1 Tax=Komagataella pastoris TaxID=4922 RepID=A0A1B2JA71_PICPA|nr:BA75_02507T0 [Komagataella pastoris]
MASFAPQGTFQQPLSTEELRFYGQLFKSLDPESLGVVTGDAARSTLEKSGLPPLVLGNIWNIADSNATGFLTQYGFAIVMRLIGHVQSGREISPDLYQTFGRLPSFNNGAPAPQQRSLPEQYTGTPQSIPPLTNADVIKFGQIFDQTAPTGILSGAEARNILLKAKLPNHVLGQIWSLADKNDLGRLNKSEFIIAMHLIQVVLSGAVSTIPSSLPQSIWDVANNTVQSSPAPSITSVLNTPLQRQLSSNLTGPSTHAVPVEQWAISPDQKQQYDRIFEGLDKDSSGFLSASESAKFLMGSKLPQNVLANIWDLSDIQNSGKFTKTEFAIAMFLVNKKVQGIELPEIVPDSLIASAGGIAQNSRSRFSPQPTQSSQTHPSQSAKPKLSSLDELSGLFNSVSPTPPVGQNSHGNFKSPPIAPPSRNNTELGSVKQFVPSSTFGQQILEKDVSKPEAPSLLEESSDDEEDNVPETVGVRRQAPPIPNRNEKANLNYEPNYGALKSIQETKPSTVRQVSFQEAPKTQQYIPQPNSDLLADSNPEVSRDLSKANTDIANISNQVSSLTRQTSELNDKRDRAQAELERILKLKEQIQLKLSNLQSSYSTEVSQVKSLEEQLAKESSETEQLRQEASLQEATFHTSQTKHTKLEEEYAKISAQNQELKQQLSYYTSSNSELKLKLEELEKQSKQSSNILSVTSQQFTIAQTENQQLEEKIEQLSQELKDSELKSHELQTSTEQLDHRKTELLERNKTLEKQLEAYQADIQSRSSQLQEAAREIQELESKNSKLNEGVEQKKVELANIGNSSRSQEGLSATTGTLVGTAVAAAAAGAAGAAIFSKDNKNNLEDVAKQSTIGSQTEKALSVNTAETSVASLPQSDYQLAPESTLTEQFSLPLVRPESLTSSVQNNAPQSVRDESEVRSSISVEGEYSNKQPQESSSEEQRPLSSEAGSYELVEAEKEHSEFPGEFPAQSEDTLDENSTAFTTANVPADSSNATNVGESLTSSDVATSVDFDKSIQPNQTDSPKNLDISAESDNIQDRYPEIETTEDQGAGEVETIDPLPEKKLLSSTDKVASLSITPGLVEPIPSTEDSQFSFEGESSEFDNEVSKRLDSFQKPTSEPEPETSSDEDGPEDLDKKVHPDVTTATPAEVQEDQEATSEDDEEFHDTVEEFPTPRTVPVSSNNPFPLFSKNDDADVPVLNDDHVEPVKPDVIKEHDEFAQLEDAALDTSVPGDFELPRSSVPAFVDEDVQLSQGTANEQDEFADLVAPRLEAGEEFDEFSKLEEAPIEQSDQLNDFENQFNNDFSNQFAESNFFNSQTQTFNDTQEDTEGGKSDEWEVLFAGFGNAKQETFAPPIQEQQNQESSSQTGFGSSFNVDSGNQAHELAIEELVGMGFTKESAVKALEKSNWKLEDATNYLLDHA